VTEWARLRWPELEDAVRESPVAVLPVGAIEEHGPHMNLGSDWYAAQRLAERIADRANLLVLPALPYGQVWSLSRFPGSISITDETLIATVVEIASGLARVGVKGLILLSGHLGNMAALKKASRQLIESGTMPSLYMLYPGVGEVAGHVITTERSHAQILHADETETSILLSLAPECVDMSKARSEYPAYPADFDYAPVYWDEVSSSGVFGDPTTATAQKGDAIVDFVVGRAVEVIQAWRKRLGT